MKTVEIYFRDLSEERQKEVLEAAGLKKPEDANWDVFPITYIDFEDEEENDSWIMATVDDLSED